jgi:3'-5' exoribonuclease
MQPCDAGSLDLSDFIPQTEEDIDVMFEQVKHALRSIRNPHLLQLVKQFVCDEALMTAFKKAPAATQMHHAYIGGLLEHTRNVLEMAMMVIPRYPELSLDLVLAGVFLHDLGKTAELTYDVSFAYSNRGQLIGHIVQCAIWIEEKARCVEAEMGQPFPPELRDALQHLVLSHHGTYAFGSPKLPALPEAIAIHHLDNLDAKLHMYLTKIRNDPDPASDWTEYVRSLETRIFKKDILGTRKKKP